ncbi:overexpressed in colon carcinoma 1 protein isoform X2 [Buteo buteo]|uniref:overexpressed in colon carcinoma 1 protein isoform X2 n=1 Tax=Buteo buteo TaxID=30397 RepID=UPI003EBB0D83
MALALVGDLRWAGNRRKYDSIIKQIPNQLRAPGAGGGMSDLAPNGAEQRDGSLCKQLQAQQRLLRTQIFTSLHQSLLFTQTSEPEGTMVACMLACHRMRLPWFPVRRKLHRKIRRK